MVACAIARNVHQGYDLDTIIYIRVTFYIKNQEFYKSHRVQCFVRQIFFGKLCKFEALSWPENQFKCHRVVFFREISFPTNILKKNLP